MMKHLPRAWARSAWIVLAMILPLAGCSLPPLEGRPPSQALDAGQVRETVLGRAAEQAAREHAGRSGIHVLDDPREAFAARVRLARLAQRTLDVQYYIWRDDTTGILLLQALREAAERGVRVRLLLDDNGLPGSLDDALAVLDAHPGVEVRLFNPFAFRPFKALGYLTDFARANRRMHNKSFTVDGAATVVGGRNVGDEYFGATDGVLFADLDVMAVGPAVQAVSASFDRYWASGSSYPLGALVAPPSPAGVQAVQQHVARVQGSAHAARYQAAVDALSFVQELAEGRLSLTWAPTRLVVDDPAKGLQRALPEQLLIEHMREALGEPQRTLDLVSPYFVPTDAGADYFAGLAERGVRVRILTNSSAATDVLAVHSGYARYRERLAAAGVQLFELKPSAGTAAPGDASREGDRGGDGDGGGERKDGLRRGLLGSSGSSLHAKTFGVDGRQVFVGSFNFDPRSARLNTELGFIIDSPEMAQRMNRVFAERVPVGSWQVLLAEDGHSLRWRDAAQAPAVLLDVEPDTTWWSRAAVGFLQLLPIEWML